MLGLVLETTWPIAPGAKIRGEIEIPASGRCIRLSGKTLGTEFIGEGEAEERYRVQVGIDQVEAVDAGLSVQDLEEDSVEDVVNALLDADCRYTGISARFSVPDGKCQMGLFSRGKAAPLGTEPDDHR